MEISYKKMISLLVICATLFLTCKKSGHDSDTNDGNGALPQSAETKPQYDNTSFGVYKGVVIGSSGFIFFRIHNDDNIARAYLNIDDQWDTLSTTSTIIEGQPLINVVFTGRFSSMTLNADVHGNFANVTAIQIAGHSNPTVFIIHENSTKQIFCYEGTFSGNSSGIFNCARAGENNGDSVYVLAKITGDTTLSNGFGHQINSGISVNLYRDLAVTFVAQGSFSGDDFNGTWTWASVGSGTFTCKRTY